MDLHNPNTWEFIGAPSHPDFDSRTEFAMLRAFGLAVLELDAGFVVRLNLDEPRYPTVEVWHGDGCLAEVHVVRRSEGPGFWYGVFDLRPEGNVEEYIDSASACAAMVEEMKKGRGEGTGDSSPQGERE